MFRVRFKAAGYGAHFVWLDVFQGGHITAPNSYFESITVQQTAPGTFK